MLALQEDEGLWLDAYKKGVLLAGPTTVLFVVRIVENLWHQEKQARNVQKVIDRGENSTINSWVCERSRSCRKPNQRCRLKLQGSFQEADVRRRT